MESRRLHPILFAIYPVLYLWGENAQEGNAGDALILLAIATGLALVLPPVLDKWLFRSLEKASVATSIGLLLFFSYGRVYSALFPTGLVIGRQRFLFPFFCLLFLAACVWLSRRPESGSVRPVLLNRVGLALVVLAVSTLWINRAPAVGLVPDLDAGWVGRAGQQRAFRPDVYYMIVDGYGRADVLAENFDFDNSTFLDGLRRRGFVVADESSSNYSSTAPSLASSLNMDFLHGPNGALMGETLEPDRLRELMRNNRLFRLLGRAGYSRHVIAPRENFLPSPDPPEELTNCGSSREFLEAFLQTTMASVGRRRWGGFTAGSRRDTVRCQFDALRNVVKKDGPKVVFFHTLVTHPPFLFHRDGSPRRVRDAVARQWRPWQPRDHYVDQIHLVNRVLEEVLDEIVESSPDAVIVVQGDHGPAGSRDWEGDLDGEYRERFGILNAIRMPRAEGQIQGGITPVNTFRVFLRGYFGVAVENLEDRSFFLGERGDSEPTDATARVRLR